MECRPNCGACCVEAAISEPLPGLPHGKPAGLRCPFLDDGDRCELFGLPGRPQACIGFLPEPAFCGTTRDEAFHLLRWIERDSAPPEVR